MIHSTNIQKLRNGEFVAFISNVISIMEKTTAATAGIAAQFGQLKDLFEPMRSSYKMERGSKITQSLVDLDRERDVLFQALRLIMIQHASAHPDENIRACSKELLDVLEQHGTDLHRKSYQEQTAGLSSIKSTIEQQPKLLETLNQLNMSAYYTAMNESNAAFDQAYLERNSEYAQLPEETIVDLRTKIEALYDTLGQRINAYLVLEENSASYEALADELNALMNSYKELLERRSSSRPDAPDADLEEVASEG